MNRIRLWPASLLALASFAAPAPAQPPASALGPNVSPNPQATSADMQEDVEIMRRLLDGAFAETYGFSGHWPGTSAVRYYPLIGPAQLEDGRLVLGQHIDSAAPHTEGVYLKDYGVVYTVTLPPTGFDPLPASKPGSGSKTPPDDWDRIRKDIRGETPAPETKVLPAHQPLSEVILKVLADNGKHFSLADGERISVAVTFRGAANCTNCHQNPWGKGQPGSPFLGNQWQALPNGSYAYGTATSTTTAFWPGATITASGGSAGPPPADGTPSYVTDARNAILLGDLHFKQGKTKEAIDAYMKAIDLLGQGIAQHQKTEPGLARQDVPALLTSVDLCNKLAAAYVQDGKADAASTMLKKASDLAKEAEGLTGGTTTAPVPARTGTAQALPSKLVVTLSKKQLNDIAAGKMTFEMFCQAATVEYVNPPAEKK